ncbi:translocator protein-like [Anthonomus grandis grandis]|uniref:translocator protein-like n=1 Tax=Anthonomus grandis grandis TaxID=2921223 RepID=UPI002166845B|nr:translocator protein-like [Anthonomus grandis grandis]XP_050301380.1 translocator protein-like [Anthonomus grandis grandis]
MDKTKSDRKWLTALQVLIAMLIPNLGGILGAVFSTNSIQGWYLTLIKPSWTPPNWLFAPVWVVLYCLMGIASCLVYRRGGGFRDKAKWFLSIYALNLILNWCWSPVFFNARDIYAAFILIIFILITAIIEAAAFGYISWIAGALILPYIAWLTIATSLNGWIYYNN